MTEEEFETAVKELRSMARREAPLEEMLEFARGQIAERSTAMQALLAFRRAFSLPLEDISRLGTWSEFSGPNPGVPAEELERELGQRLRASIRDDEAAG